MANRTTISFAFIVVVLVLATQIEQGESFLVPDFIGQYFHLCGCPDTAKCESNCATRFNGTAGRCSGFLHARCECQIKKEWLSKERQC
ncbi:unnamed protein product [Adineta ricciae]|uniref:Uncharacterized protein n=1 Tax=Adineta ricciae TaxID=249248 RepID=A0A815G9C1_ADIRI|nr:unnamed protein product [Adineta ricciae]